MTGWTPINKALADEGTKTQSTTTGTSITRAMPDGYKDTPMMEQASEPHNFRANPTSSDNQDGDDGLDSSLSNALDLETSARLSDNEIFQKGLVELKGANLLQVAQRNGTQGMIAKLEQYHGKSQLTYNTLTKRLHYAKELVATEQGYSIAQVQAALDAARTRTGTHARKNRDIAAKTIATKALKKLKLQGEDTEANERDGDETDDYKTISVETHDDKTDDDKTDDDEGTVKDGSVSSSNELATMQGTEKHAKFIEECEALARGPRTNLRGDNLLNIAKVFTNAEIIYMTNEANPDARSLTSNAMLQRLQKAKQGVARREGKPYDQVRTQFEAMRVANGVTSRMRQEGAKARAASLATKKAEKLAAEVDGDAMDVDVDGFEEEDDGWSPLEDLEELGRRHEAQECVYGAFGLPTPAG